jgi:hypothetical protein
MPSTAGPASLEVRHTAGRGQAVSDLRGSNGPRLPVPDASITPQGDPATALPRHQSELLARHPIGLRLEAFRRELIACGQAMQGTAPFQGRLFFNDALTSLAQLTCRIAVIGQVKAGKSSLINAFVGIPSLLPTDINPWTTAVTHLHFGSADAPTGVAAQFTFFAPDEWERLAHGGGRIRELTQRLVPGFEVELLQEHVDAMRRRSEERLGSALGDLLGKKHVFQTLSPGVLERYVSSGAPGLPVDQAEHAGIYSDIVKAADLFFSSYDFGLPTTIIDTPGTNDPFLVRDEITRRALEAADIYVVVLTARQALSSADVALLRILRGLHKDRIVVFINRIDELVDVLRDSSVIVQHVRTGLRREFPTSEIPVVAGSAFWAETAIGTSDAELGRSLSKKVKAYARHLAQQASANVREERPSQTLLRCGGLPALSDVIAGLTLRSRVSHTLKQACKSFRELGQVGRNATQQAITIVETERMASLSRQQRDEEELRAIDADVKRNEQLTVALQSLLVDLGTNMDRVIEERCAKTLDVLRYTIAAFSEVECDKLQRAIVDGHRDRVWQCDTSSLRRDLEECFVTSYRGAGEEISTLEAQVFPQLQELLSRHDSRWRRPDETRIGSDVADLPSLGALSQIVALDLEEPWWRRWWARSSNLEARVGSLDHLIRQEFYPIVDALVQAAHAHLKARQSSALQTSRRIYLGLVDFLQEQNRARRARTRVLIAAADTSRRGEMHRNQEAGIAELKQQIPIVEALLHRLESIDRLWSDMIS